MRFVAVATLLLMIACGGCATLERGTKDVLYVTSEPPGATATTSFGENCVTPCSFDVNRRDSFSVTIAKAGYRGQTMVVATRLSGRGVGDVMEDVASAGIGLIVDAGTGAALDHTPNPVSVTLQPLGAAPQHRPQS